jgi:hypothetical protein
VVHGGQQRGAKKKAAEAARVWRTLTSNLQHHLRSRHLEVLAGVLSLGKPANKRSLLAALTQAVAS